MKKKTALTILALLVATMALALDKESRKAITMVSYDQGWMDYDGKIALKNNTDEEITNLKFQIIYLNMKGVQLHYEVYSRKTSIAPGMTRELAIPAYEHGRFFSYYKSEAAPSSPHRFKIRFELKEYNGVATPQTADQDFPYPTEETTPDKHGTPSGKGWLSTTVKKAGEFLDWTFGQHGSKNLALLLLGINLCVGLYVLVATMAMRRNRNATAWVFASLFITPFIAMLLLLLMGTPYAYHNQRYAPGEDDEDDDHHTGHGTAGFGRGGFGAQHSWQNGFGQQHFNNNDWNHSGWDPNDFGYHGFAPNDPGQQGFNNSGFQP